MVRRIRDGFSSKNFLSRYRHFLLYSAAGTLIFLFSFVLKIPFEGSICVHKFFHQTIHFLANIWPRLTGQQILLQENEKLRRQCQYYAYLLQEQNYEEQMLERLGLFLSMEQNRHFRYVYARVLRRDVQWWWNAIQIDKGSDDGIAEGLGVICPHGVVGKIHHVSRHSATVELITSPDFRSVVHVEGDMRPFLYEGQTLVPWSLKVPQGKISQCPLDIHDIMTHKLKIVSSELSGTFPDGIYYGTTSSFTTNPQQYSETFVQLFPEIQSLKEVIVLIPDHETERDDAIEKKINSPVQS
ncbi:MAG: rod shape-determining protein MreC [Puniceicoccales bacterium]|jgi:rod shape-determining protein MreC|nr:rod shape-determining protein MreC [Puniceicoccales bacterium]